MWRLILSVVMLALLAVVVAYNASSETAIALPGVQLENVSVVALALLSFVFGVVYSFLLYLFARLDRRRKERLKKMDRKLADKKGVLEDREDELKDREGELKSREKQVEKPKDASAEQPAETGILGRLLHRIGGNRKHSRTAGK